MKRTKYLKKAVAVHKDVVNALLNREPFQASSATRLPPMRNLSKVVEMLTSGAESPTWHGTVPQWTKRTEEGERALMTTLDYLADYCPKITNGDIARSAVKITDGDLPMAIFLMRNASVNIGAFLREFFVSGADVYRRIPHETSNYPYYALPKVEKIAKKLSFLEDHPVQRLSDPIGPWYHFFGGLFAEQLKLGSAVYLEILLYDHLFPSRNPMILQNEGGKLGVSARLKVP